MPPARVGTSSVETRGAAGFEPAGGGFVAALGARPVAIDPVCLCNGDLGCIRVRVDERTPRADYAGRTYYFCAESCREAFLKDPARYTRPESGR